MHEPLFVMLSFGAIALLRHFRDRDGLSFAERGAHELRFGPRGRAVARFLAICGAVQLSFFCLYNVPHAVVGAHSAAWPADLVHRSYLTDQLCGPHTDRRCPGEPAN
jgi:hypothetical protein